jgi:hypothetical protein
VAEDPELKVWLESQLAGTGLSRLPQQDRCRRTCLTDFDAEEGDRADLASPCFLAAAAAAVLLLLVAPFWFLRSAEKKHSRLFAHAWSVRAAKVSNGYRDK